MRSFRGAFVRPRSLPGLAAARDGASLWERRAKCQGKGPIRRRSGTRDFRIL